MKYETVELFDKETTVRRFVKRCDELLESRIEDGLAFLKDIKEIRLLGLTGPTCSGKTTAARKMTAILEAMGYRVHLISLDDFFYDIEYLHRRADADPDIEIDYDSEETIDVELLSREVENLLACREAHIPHFDFHTGKRVNVPPICPHAGDVFLFEGIQILYPKVRAILEKSGSYYCQAICPMSGIETESERFTPNEIRFFRRLVRDFRHRSTSPAFTFYLWKSVRENEERNIFPYMHLCHSITDSTVPYEIGMLKPHLLPLLGSITSELPYYEEAQIYIKRLAGVQPVKSEYMTPNSLYKEFI